MFSVPLLSLSLLLPVPLPRSPASLVDPVDRREDEKLLRDAGMGVDGPALRAFLRQRTFGPAEQKRAEVLIIQLGNELYAVREKASAELVLLGQAAMPLLRRAERDEDAEVRRRARNCLRIITSDGEAARVAAVLHLLPLHASPATVGVLLDYLSCATDETLSDDVLHALLLTTWQTGSTNAVLPTALSDANPRRRGAAALVLGRLGTREQRTVVRRLLHDAEASVRLRAAQGLLAGRDREVIPVLLDLLTTAPFAVAEQAEGTLAFLAGEQLPHIVLGSEEGVRRACRGAWESWWKAHADQIDLRNAALDPLDLDTTRRTLVVTRQFLDAIFVQADLARVRRSIGFPFWGANDQRYDSFAALEEVLQHSLEMMRAQKLSWKIEGSMPARRFVRTANAQERKRLANMPVEQVRIFQVYVYDKANVQDNFNLHVFVRLRGSQARVMALGRRENPSVRKGGK